MPPKGKNKKKKQQNGSAKQAAKAAVKEVIQEIKTSKPKGSRAYKPKGTPPGSTKLQSAPAATDGGLRTNYMKAAGNAPLHKDWGPGSRYRGCTVLGSIKIFGTTDARVFTPMSAIVPTDYDTMSFWWPLHPFLLGRLNKITYLFGKYVFRQIKLHYSPMCGTGQSTGFALSVCNDISGALKTEQDNTPASPPSLDQILSCCPSNLSSFWREFSMTWEDWKTERTFPCDLPQYDESKAQSQTLDTTIAETYFQAAMISVLATSGATATAPLGYINLEYVVDFYTPRSMVSTHLSATLGDSDPVSRSVAGFLARRRRPKDEEKTRSSSRKRAITTLPYQLDTETRDQFIVRLVKLGIMRDDDDNSKELPSLS